MKPKIVFHDRKMAIPTGKEIVFRYYDELMYILFDKPYCWLHFTGNTKYRVEVTLQYMMNHLPEGAFMICKRSYMVNLCYCKGFRKHPSVIVMEDDKEIKLSKQNMLDFRQMMDNLSHISPPCPVCYTCTESHANVCRWKKARQNKEPI